MSWFRIIIFAASYGSRKHNNLTPTKIGLRHSYVQSTSSSCSSLWWQRTRPQYNTQPTGYLQLSCLAHIIVSHFFNILHYNIVNEWTNKPNDVNFHLFINVVTVTLTSSFLKKLWTIRFIMPSSCVLETANTLTGRFSSLSQSTSFCTQMCEVSERTWIWGGTLFEQMLDFEN